MHRIIVLACLLLAGCGTPASTTSVADASASPSAPPNTATSAPAAAGCLQVSAAMLAGIAQGQEAGVGMAPIAGAAVKSPDYEKVYFIAMKFSGTGIEPQVGVWASDSLTPGGGLLMSVDGFAKEFTVWPDADSTDAEISGADPSVAAAKECL